jgi:transcription antitermination factor NusG
MKKIDLIRNWHIAYTFPKAEKQVFATLKKMEITSYLPLQRVTRTWSDRQKQIELPLFPNYIFIYTSARERYIPLQIKNILRYVSFGGEPAIVTDSVIDSLKKMVDKEVEISNDKFPSIGVRVKINQGPFAGVEGLLIRKNGKTRLTVQIESLNREVSVEIPASIATAMQYEELV